MNENIIAPYIFVIDTKDYAGNFERELCAYITGKVGQCEVGQEMAESFLEETKLIPFENVIEEPDEHGCYRPVTIYPSKNTSQYNSVAILFDSKPTKDQIDLMKKRALKFANLPSEWIKTDKRISKITGFRLIKNTIKREEEKL